MEEGPEPQEVIERTVEHQHHQHEKGHETGERRQLMLPAMAAALLAVLAALGSLLSGHAANQAILNQSRASDKWAYFQAKSTKGHLYEVSREMVAALASPVGKGPGDKADAARDRFHKEAERYNQEKKELQQEAEHLEQESREEFHKHHQFALGIACFQVGIVLASVSILTRYRGLFYLSLAAGVVGIVFLGLGLATGWGEKGSGEQQANLVFSVQCSVFSEGEGWIGDQHSAVSF